MWKKGRGKLGLFAPLIGQWVASGDSDLGPYRCTRTFVQTLGGAYVALNACWTLGAKRYEEYCLFGFDAEGKLRFWSFTSDGKQSNGELTEAADVHAQALAFVAEMPAGIARMIYWPDDDGFQFAVESKTKKGWNRFTRHQYRRLP